jgi:hypothetical protein
VLAKANSVSGSIVIAHAPTLGAMSI